MSLVLTRGLAIDLLKASEQHGRHPCTRHVAISSADLQERLYQGAPPPPTATCATSRPS